jgi:hypothetical protein
MLVSIGMGLISFSVEPGLSVFGGRCLAVGGGEAAFPMGGDGDVVL